MNNHRRVAIKMNIFEKTNDSKVCDFILMYLTYLGVMWTVFFVIDNTFWVLPLIWYFGAKPIESSIKKYYHTLPND